MLRLFAPSRFFSLLAIAAGCLLTMPQFAAADDEEPIELSPDNPDVVALIKVSEILKSPGFKKATADNADLAAKLDEPMGKTTKMTPRDLKTIYVFGNMEKKEFVAVIEATKEIDEAELTEGEDVKQEKIGEYTLYTKPSEPTAVTLVDDYTLAIGPPETLRKVLKRDDDAKISDEFDAAWEDVDDTKHVYVVASLGSLTKMAGGSLPPGFPITPDQLQKLKSASVTAEAAASGIKIASEVDCSEAELATQLKVLIEAMLAQQAAAMPPPVQAVLGTVKAKTDEETLAISLEIGIDLLVNLAKSQGAVPTP